MRHVQIALFLTTIAVLLIASTTPSRRIRFERCPRATTGHAAAPPIPAMNSRRRIHPSRKDWLG